ncbi:Uma2 family endonuclease [Kineococcus sp. LSe6-4]|uniref:Uma2 family endonuclease n=1 Tax=Kineococcus halophytocola TaxID=3234027 RepID=A0ABV4H6L3_9ACTN
MSVSVTSVFPLTWEDLPRETAGPRMELIDGSLHVTPLGDLRHQRLIMTVAQGLAGLAPAGWVVLPGANVLRRGATDRLLIPDVVVLAEDAVAAGGVYADPSDVLLVVEVECPSTRSVDRLLKRDLYAQWRISDYWVLDPEVRALTRLVLGPDRSYAPGRGSADWLAAYDEGGLWP